MMNDLVTAWQRLQDELTREERCESGSGLHSILLRKRRREETHNQFEAVMREIRLLRQRIKRLPKLPDPTHIVWAQNILLYPNGRILAVDTLPDADETAISRIMLMDFGGTIQFDTRVNWGGVLDLQTMRRPGITPQELWHAPSLVQVWPSLLDALAGTYIVSFGFDRTRRLLEMLAVQYDLEPPALIGECLQRRCLLYFAETGFAGFSSFCTLVGHSLPDAPDCTAVDRARGQLHILQAIAQGVIGVYQTDAICDQQEGEQEQHSNE